MGDPKRHRKKYSGPSHPWQAARIEEERNLTTEYGFKNKQEIWRMASFLRNAAAQAKKLVTLKSVQTEKEKELLLKRLKRYGLLPADAALDAILSITLRDVLERRLQTQVYKQHLANSVKQARQFIIHGHITIAGKKVTSPSYFVPLSEETQIGFVAKSTLADTEHPERAAARSHAEKEAKEKLVVKTDEAKEGFRKRSGDRGRDSRRQDGRRPERQGGRPGSRSPASRAPNKSK